MNLYVANYSSLAPLPSAQPGHLFNRVHVLAIGCTIWGACTAAFGMTNSMRTGTMLW